MGKYITKTAEKIKPEGLSKTREVHPGDLILSNSMSFGRPYIMAINGCIHDGWLLLRNDKNLYDLQFLCYLLGSENMLHQYKSFAAGSTVNNLNKDLVGNTTVSFPKKTEQSKLGAFFDSLDNLITLHQRKLDKLSNVKKALLEKMFPKNDLDVPEIRFKGFTDAWEQRKFEDIAVRSSMVSSESGLPRVEYEDIISGTGCLKKDIFAKESGKTGIVFHKGDVLYGKLRPYLQNWLLPTFNGLAVGDFWVIQPQDIDSRFLYRLIQSHQFDEVANQSAGTKMPRADWKLIAKTEFLIPNNIDEQAIIGTYFACLDHLITLNQRKCNKLLDMKKSMLEKMFPKDGANVPEVRFKGFTEAWEQRKLGAIMNVTSVKRIHQSDWTNSGVRFLRARDIVSAAKNEEPEDYLYISKDKYDECSMISGKVALGDILVTGVGTIGVPYLIKDLAPLYFKDGNIIWFQNENKVDGHFLLYSFWSETVQRFIEESAGTGTVGTYTIESGKRTPIYLPRKKEEQHRVGDFFRCLDHLITLHQRKYEKLLNVKKSMLEKMFPRDGADVPEIRFAGFTDAWEQRKVGEMIEDYVEKTIIQNQFPVLTSSQQQGIVLQEEYFADRQVTTDDNIGYYVLPKGYFTYRSRSDTNTFVFNRNDIIDKGIISYYYPVFKANNADSNFLLRRLNHGTKSQLSFIAEGTGQKVLAHSKFKNIAVYVPNIEEQKSIGSFFENLDTLITLHQRKLEKLKNIKKSCLKKMFV